MKPNQQLRTKPVRRDRRGRKRNPVLGIPKPTCRQCRAGTYAPHDLTPECPRWPLRRYSDRELALVYRIARMALGRVS